MTLSNRSGEEKIDRERDRDRERDIEKERDRVRDREIKSDIIYIYRERGR